jgi:hypothetical protein
LKDKFSQLFQEYSSSGITDAAAFGDSAKAKRRGRVAKKPLSADTRTEKDTRCSAASFGGPALTFWMKPASTCPGGFFF